METFTIRNLTFSYPQQTEKVIDDFSLSVKQGDFLVLCGPSGCGKSTLLRQLKTVLAPCGRREGEILFEGMPLDAVDRRTQSQKIGFVQQSPENQIVTDKVWHELAFGLESLGYDTPTIRRKVAEMASFFGIENWFYKNVTELSGGQKQLLNLASVMAMSPSVLILDEPTSRLDPIAASDFLAVLGKINRELGTTIILSEHRLEEALPLATAVAVMVQGRLFCSGTPKEVGEGLKDHAAFLAMPTAMRVWAAVEDTGNSPVTVREGRNWLTDFAEGHALQELPAQLPHSYPDETVMSAKEVWFRYEKDGPDVVKGLTFSVRKGEFLAILGGNGTGKTTSLKLLAGLLKPYRGQVRRNGKVCLLPQDPQTLFVKKTVREDLLEISDDVESMVHLCRLQGLLDRHPYDLSGGEQQRVALAKVLLTDPEILLLDEPTKGLDSAFKRVLAEILKQLLSQGIAVVMVSHDVEFCACYAHTCAMFFDGGFVTKNAPRAFFSGNNFYTTAANRIARDLVPEAVTVEDLISVCGGKLPPENEPPENKPERPACPGEEPSRTKRGKPRIGKRSIVTTLLILLLIPLTLWAGTTYLDSRKYYFTALLVLLECMVPFFLVFESRKPRARELVIIAVLCAIGVAGRAAFFMLPQFKPITALTIIAGVALGGEAGFLVGSVTMLVSNMLFSQGPWTPWQMFCTGIIGFLAGVLFRRGRLRRSRLALSMFGALAALIIYGGIMNPASALMWMETVNWKIIAAHYVSGFPMDCVHAAATWLFLWLTVMPMLEKLDRIKVKYGLVE